VILLRSAIGYRRRTADCVASSDHLTTAHRASSGGSSLLNPAGFGFCGGQWLVRDITDARSIESPAAPETSPSPLKQSRPLLRTPAARTWATRAHLTSAF